MEKVCTVGNRYAAFVAIRKVIKDYVSDEILSELDMMFLNGELTLGQYIDGAIASVEDENDIEVLESLYDIYSSVLSTRGCDIDGIRGSVEEVKKIIERAGGSNEKIK